MRDWIAIAQALSDPSRVRILKMLEAGERCVCELTACLALAQSTVSRHLAVLRQAGLVEDRKEGLWVYYRLPEAPTAAGAAFLTLLSGQLNDDAAVQADRAALAQACCPEEAR